MRTFEVKTLDDLARFAREVVTHITPQEKAFTITLGGDLGVGKTAFVKLLGSHLGVLEEITSPTFVVMKSYGISHTPFTTLTHIDAYRIDDEDEMRVLGLETLLKDPARIVCIEWPERIHTYIPKTAYSIDITLNADHSRTITYGYQH